ncbi:hypothetical protein HDU76_000837 [Blyttiomyces sp. JEL0837]|nr:hypothetical protein HDU76_000837 [Blyttiomyces sp. JEL0837]
MDQNNNANPIAPAAEPQIRPPFAMKNPLLRKAFSNASTTSPTDQVMSPATQKIEAKRKHLLMNIKPKFLGEALKEGAVSEQKTQPQ